MFENMINKFLTFFATYWENSFIVGIIMTSAVIVLIGLLKPLLFNKISSKPLRKVALAFSNIALCFGATAIYFVIRPLPFSLYVFSAIAVSLFSIVVYWFYENTLFRDLISKIGNLVLKNCKLLLVKWIANDDAKAVKNEAVKVVNILSKTTKENLLATLKKTNTDKELKDL